MNVAALLVAKAKCLLVRYKGTQGFTIPATAVKEGETEIEAGKARLLLLLLLPLYNGWRTLHHPPNSSSRTCGNH